MKVAVIHDWLVTYGGADRVLEQILACYPQADLFSLVDFLPAELRGFVLNKHAKTSFVQHLPFARSSFRHYLPLMPLAMEQLDLSSYELVISNSHSVAKGVLTSPDQLHVCYCHSPMRYAWDLQHQYMQESRFGRGITGWLTRYVLHRIRIWDVRTSVSVDKFIANSEFVARRINKVYRRKATVIYPPVDLSAFELRRDKQDFYLTVSRFVPYKRIGLLVEAFNRMPDKQLVVIGDGAEFASIQAKAQRNVKLIGFQDSQRVVQYMQNARAFVFAAEEDFGICIAEALACGTPVIAFGKGGALEIVHDIASEQPTGLFFNQQTPEAIANAIQLFERESVRFDPGACRRSVMRFSHERFRSNFREFCDNHLANAHTRQNEDHDSDLISDVVTQF